jgi:hypothetical protein
VRGRCRRAQQRGAAGPVGGDVLGLLGRALCGVEWRRCTAACRAVLAQRIVDAIEVVGQVDVEQDLAVDADPHVPRRHAVVFEVLGEQRRLDGDVFAASHAAKARARHALAGLVVVLGRMAVRRRDHRHETLGQFGEGGARVAVVGQPFARRLEVHVHADEQRLPRRLPSGFGVLQRALPGDERRLLRDGAAAAVDVLRCRDGQREGKGKRRARAKDDGHRGLSHREVFTSRTDLHRSGSARTLR